MGDCLQRDKPSVLTVGDNLASYPTLDMSYGLLGEGL